MTSTFYSLEELGWPEDSGRADDPPRGPRGESTVLEVNDLPTLAELRPVWNELVRQTAQPRFCHSLDWLTLYGQQRSLALSQRPAPPTDSFPLRALFVDNGDETTGLVVLVAEPSSTGNVLSLPCIGEDILTPLGHDISSLLNAVVSHLQAELSQGAVLDLRGLSELEFADARGSLLSRFKLQCEPSAPELIVPIPASVQAAWSSLPRPVQQTLQRGERQAASLGLIGFERFRPQATDCANPSVPSGLYERCLAIALNDEHELRAADSPLNDPARHDFLRALFPLAWRNAAADVCLLSIGARPVAFRFHTHARGSLHTVWSGTDAEFRDLPLEELLLHRTVQDSVSRRDRTITLSHLPSNAESSWPVISQPRFRVLIGTPSRVRRVAKIGGMAQQTGSVR